MKRIIYSELSLDTKTFFTLLGAIALFVVMGALAFFYMEHHGHAVSGMNNQVVWGIPHVFAIFLIVAASGALNVGSIGTVFGRKIYQPLGRLSGLIAIALLVSGLTVLVLDLGRPDRLIVAMTKYNFKSIFSWNIILYNGFIILVIMYLVTMMFRKARGFYKPAGIAAFVWRLILTMGTGSIFGFLVAREAFDSAILGPEFIIFSFVIGLAIFNLITFALFALSDKKMGSKIKQRLSTLLAIFILSLLAFEAIRHLTNLYATEHHGIEAFILNGESFYSKLYWYGFFLIGSVIPVFLIFCKKIKTNGKTLLIASALSLVGGFSLLYVILIGGQVYPLNIIPNSIVESSFNDGVIAHYSASLPEIILGMGGIAVFLILVLIAVTNLRFIPASMADSEIASDSD